MTRHDDDHHPDHHARVREDGRLHRNADRDELERDVDHNVFSGQTASRNGGPSGSATTAFTVPPETCNGKLPTIEATPGDDKISGPPART